MLRRELAMLQQKLDMSSRLSLEFCDFLGQKRQKFDLRRCFEIVNKFVRRVKKESKVEKF